MSIQITNKEYKAVKKLLKKEVIAHLYYDGWEKITDDENTQIGKLNDDLSNLISLPVNLKHIRKIFTNSAVTVTDTESIFIAIDDQVSILLMRKLSDIAKYLNEFITTFKPINERLFAGLEKTNKELIEFKKTIPEHLKNFISVKTGKIRNNMEAGITTGFSPSASEAFILARFAGDGAFNYVTISQSLSYAKLWLAKYDEDVKVLREAETAE
jgi:hypothetical protein